IGLNPDPPYNIRAISQGTPQILHVFGAVLRLWGVPGDPVHDPIRGRCAAVATDADGEPGSLGNCPGGAPIPFLTLPRACHGAVEACCAPSSGEDPARAPPDGDPVRSDPRGRAGGGVPPAQATPPQPLGMTGCGKLGFKPETEAVPTTHSAETGSGLD